MEIKQNATSDKKDEVIQKIKVLETEIQAVKDELHAVENEGKIMCHSMNVLEVKKNKLSQSIQFYESRAKRLRSKLWQKLSVHSKFVMATECYDYLLKVYKENYLTELSCGKETLGASTPQPDFEKQMQSLQTQIKDLNTDIEKNSSTLKCLLQNLENPSTS